MLHSLLFLWSRLPVSRIGGGSQCISLHCDKQIKCLLSTHSFPDFFHCFVVFLSFWFLLIIVVVVIVLQKVIITNSNIVFCSSYLFLYPYLPSLTTYFSFPSLLFILESFKFAREWNLWRSLFVVVSDISFSFTI